MVERERYLCKMHNLFGKSVNNGWSRSIFENELAMIVDDAINDRKIDNDDFSIICEERSMLLREYYA